MGRISGIALIICMGAFGSVLQGQSGNLVIILSNLKSNSGKIMIAAYDDPDTFLGDEAVAVHMVPVKDIQDNKVVMKDLSYGQYALSLFHDENDNGKLDSNFFKIPKEPFGFSNDAKGRFGPPKYQAARFDFKEDGQVIQVRLKKI